MQIHQCTSMRHQHGFTLLELMITVAIVGILAAIAYPSYVEYVNKGKRTEGMAALLQAAQQQERYFTTNNTYTTDAALARIPEKSEQGTYSISIAANGTIATGFTVTATPVSPWTDSKCGNLTLNNAGVKGTSAGSVEDCWK